MRRKRPDRKGWLRLAAGTLGLAAMVLIAREENRLVILEREEEESVPFSIRVRKTWLLAKGWEVILREGRSGKAKVTKRYRYRGGRLLGREEMKRAIIRPPRREVRLVGVSPRKNPVNAPRMTRAVRSHRMLTTGYGPGPQDNTFEWAGITKLGWRTRRGIVAVDPKVIPLRTLLYVEGYGLAWAGDVGGAIKGNRLDLCFNDTEEALEWGRRQRYAYVLQGVKR